MSKVVSFSWLPTKKASQLVKKPTKLSVIFFHQPWTRIPIGMDRGLAIEFGVDKMGRTFPP